MQHLSMNMQRRQGASESAQGIDLIDPRPKLNEQKYSPAQPLEVFTDPSSLSSRCLDLQQVKLQQNANEVP